MDDSGMEPHTDTADSTDDRTGLRHFLAERDVKCPSCDYELRNLESDRCPGCGKPLELQLGRERTVSIPWVLGFIGLSATLGPPVLGMIVCAIITVIQMMSDSNTMKVLGVYTLSTAGIAFLIWLWCRYREQFLRLEPNVQYAYVAVSVVIYLVSLMVHYDAF